VILHFPSCEKAIAYARRNDLAYAVVPEPRACRRLKSYADNFCYDRGNRPPYSH
jgi:hypothetical protein